MEDLSTPGVQVEPPPTGEIIPPAGRGRKSACLLIIMGALMCLVCVIAGAIVFSLYKFRAWNVNPATQSFYLHKEKICEMAFVQQTVMVDTRSEFTWNIDIPLTNGLELGRADIKVKGVYTVKYGIDQSSVNLWQYFPDTRELQISMPEFKVIGIQTVLQELDSENESILKKLHMSERNQAFKRNRDDATAQANAAIASEAELRNDCIDQLKKLLASFGINLILIDNPPVAG